MERFLLLWDDLDDVAGAARHLTLNVLHDAGGLGRSALERMGGWTAGLWLRAGLSPTGGAPEA